MSEITDYGQLMGKTIVKIFGNEIIYNDLNLYARKDTIHVEVCRRRCPETRKQYIEVYFDGKIVLNECYAQYHSCDMFYYLNELETEMENERKEWADEYNNSLPTQTYYDTDGEEHTTIGVGGIHDSEYDCYVYENVDIYGRIEKLKNPK
jgi:hypothetical protein